MTPDARDRPAWEEGYRHGVLLVWLPGDVGRRYDEARREVDPRSAAIAPAHVSISTPLTREPTPRDLDELAGLVARVAAFDVTLGPPRAPRPAPGVVVDVTPGDRVLALRDAVHRAAVFHGRAYARHDVPPHVTLAEFIDDARAARVETLLRGRLGGETFRCATLSLAVPDERFRFHSRGELRLGAT